MLPKIRQAMVVAVDGDAGLVVTGLWSPRCGAIGPLLKFAEQAMTAPLDDGPGQAQGFYRVTADRSFLALPLGSRELVIIVAELLGAATARASLVRFIKAAMVWYRLLQQHARLGRQAVEHQAAGQQVRQQALAHCPALARELVATQPLAAASALLASRLARLWRQRQLALFHCPDDQSLPTLIALSDSSTTQAASEAVRNLRTEAAELLARAPSTSADQLPVGKLRTANRLGLLAEDGLGGRWLLTTEPNAGADSGLPLWQTLAPLLALKREEGRTLYRWHRKLVRVPIRHWLLVPLLVLPLLLPVPYRISAPAELEGRIQRAVVAPTDGFIRASHVRAGDTVTQGDLIAQLDDDELQLQQKKLTNELADLERQYRQALVDSELSQSRLVKNQIAQAQAELELVAHQLNRSQLEAPFSGVIIKGDLTRSEGAPVDKGQVLFEIAPAGEFRLVIRVDERYMMALAPGRQGRLYLNAQPSQGLAFTLVRVASVATAQDEGPQRYRLEAELESGVGAQNSAIALQPGMQGVAKINSGRRPLLWVLLHRPWHWLLLKWWAWAP